MISDADSISRSSRRVAASLTALVRVAGCGGSGMRTVVARVQADWLQPFTRRRPISRLAHLAPALVVYHMAGLVLVDQVVHLGRVRLAHFLGELLQGHLLGLLSCSAA